MLEQSMLPLRAVDLRTQVFCPVHLVNTLCQSRGIISRKYYCTVIAIIYSLIGGATPYFKPNPMLGLRKSNQIKDILPRIGRYICQSLSSCVLIGGGGGYNVVEGAEERGVQYILH